MHLSGVLTNPPQRFFQKVSLGEAQVTDDYLSVSASQLTDVFCAVGKFVVASVEKQREVLRQL